LKYPALVRDLSRTLARLPGIGPRTAERLALSLASRPEEAEDLARVLFAVQENIHPCRICGYFAESDLCPICADTSRDVSVICVVEGPADLLAIERSGGFRGTYHLLGGVLNPLEGVDPGSLNLDSLWSRLRKNARELILATPMTVEGEATAAYIADVAARLGVKSTRPAYGLPMGGALEYTDELTLAHALANRHMMTKEG
jgi:recombination protein RecR